MIEILIIFSMTVHTSTYITSLTCTGTIRCERTRVHGENGGGEAERKSAGQKTQGNDRTSERGEGSNILTSSQS